MRRQLWANPLGELGLVGAAQDEIVVGLLDLRVGGKDSHQVLRGRGTVLVALHVPIR